MDNLLRKYTNEIIAKDLKKQNLFKEENYSNLNNKYKEELIQEGEKWLTKTLPPLSFNLFREYKETGNRTNFQDISNIRRFALNSIFFAELIERKGRFIPKLIEFLYEILSELVWWLPAHNVYERDGENSGYPDPTRPIIALFCAETASQISIITNTFEKKLPIELINLATKELEERIFTPYENNHYWWMAKEGSFVNNWNPWCTQNILLSYANFINFKKERMLKFIKKASFSLDCFFSSYGEDGCCEEGPQYFHVAGGNLFGAIEIINECSNNKISNIFLDKKLKNIATYIQKVHVNGPYYINFGDCNSKSGDCRAKDYLFALRVKEDSLKEFIEKNWLNVKDKLMKDERNLFDRYLSLEYVNNLDSLSKKLIKKEIKYPTFTKFESKGLYIFRDNKNTLAVQAGSNYQSHNHNDTGSFIYYKNNNPLFIDIGVEEYSEKSFSNLRYTIWTMKSDFHNLTNFEEVVQVEGKNSICEIKELSKNSITMELSKAYPKQKNIQSYIRNLKLENGNLFLEDKVNSQIKPTLTLMVENPVFIINNNLIKIGNEEVKIEGENIEIKVESIKITDSRMRISLPDEIMKISLHYKKTIRILT